MNNPESTLLRRLMLAVSAAGARIFRNQVGSGWYGKSEVATGPCVAHLNAGDVVIRQARRIVSGLCQGSSDLIGWRSVDVTPLMVGQQVAVFTAIEAKSATGRLTPEQRNFLDTVRAAGGIGIEARDVNDAVAKLKHPRN